MEDTGKINPLDIKIQGLLDRFLKVSSAENNTFTTQDHLDEDTLSAFVEGNLREREAKPVVSHLVDCSFCRNITTQLIRLDLAFAGETETIPVTENQPTKIADVLSGILTRIFGSNEGAVFAHHEENQDEDENSESEKKD
ncbi:MAG: hypothetical protein ACR2F2_04490 [Pyrinomonadaceae bacterium]